VQLPHDHYIDAVLDALSAAELGPDRYFTETSDGERLDAVLSWSRNNLHVNTAEWPHGVLICWSQLDFWEYAGIRADGYNDSPRELIREEIPSPDSVVEAVRVLLRTAARLPAPGTPWVLKADLACALDQWHAN
jgi:hypothetical protein